MVPSVTARLVAAVCLASSAALAVTPIPDADMARLLDEGGVSLALKAQPMFFFGRAMGRPPCVPTWATTGDGQKTASSPLCSYPNVGCDCVNPDKPIGNVAQRFPIYYSYSRCSETMVRVAYNLFYTKDGTRISGHAYDWERVLVELRRADDTQWRPHTLHMSQHSGYARMAWDRIPNTFSTGDAGLPRGGDDGRRGLDHAKVYVAWSKHAHFPDRNTAWNDPLSQLTGNAFRSQDWWYFATRGESARAGADGAETGGGGGGDGAMTVTTGADGCQTTISAPTARPILGASSGGWIGARRRRTRPRCTTASAPRSLRRVPSDRADGRAGGDALMRGRCVDAWRTRCCVMDALMRGGCGRRGDAVGLAWCVDDFDGHGRRGRRRPSRRSSRDAHVRLVVQAQAVRGASSASSNRSASSKQSASSGKLPIPRGATPAARRRRPRPPRHAHPQIRDAALAPLTTLPRDAVLANPPPRANTCPAAAMVRQAESSAALAEELARSTYVAVDFFADWCAPCRAIAPVFAQLAARHALPGHLAFVKVNVDVARDAAAAYRVAAMPTFLFFKNGRQVAVNGDAALQGADHARLVAAVEKLAALAQRRAAEAAQP